jgi:hypothetical protein
VIRNNTFGDVGHRKAGTFSAAVASTDAGNYGISVTGNTSRPTSSAGAPDYFVYSAGGNGSWQISGNRVGEVLQETPYGGVEFLPVDKDAVSQMSGLQQAGGDIVLGSDGEPRWRVVWPRVGYGAAAPVPALVTVAMAAGSRVAQIVANGSGSWMDLPPGMNVVVAGAGGAGGDLLARIVSNNATAEVPMTGARVILDTPAEVDVIAAAVTMQQLRVVPLRRGLFGR